MKPFALSVCVSPQTIFFWVLDKSPFLGPRSGSLLEKGLVTGRRQENAGNTKTTVAHYDGILLIAIQRRLV